MVVCQYGTFPTLAGAFDRREDSSRMARVTETFTISIPPEMAEELERVRKEEYRTRSELIREALRLYFRVRDRNSNSINELSSCDASGRSSRS